VPFLGQHIRITWRFNVFSTDEIAETSLNFSGGVAPWTGAVATLAELDESDLDDTAASLVTLMGTSGLNWADYSTLVSTKAAAIGTDGSYLTDPLIAVLSPSVSGTAGNTLPQDTCCLSLRTNTNVGQGVRGRMFLPHTRMTLPAGFAITSSVTRDAIATAGAAFVDAVNTSLSAAVTGDLIAVIMGQTGSGTVKGVTFVRCGGVTDTQRRRRNGIPELYSVAAV
jgi:hypothetical protein